jgi:hypothetical protein
MIVEFIGKEIIAGEQIGIIGPKDYMSSTPHTHLQVIIPPEPIVLTKDSQELSNLLIRYFVDITVPSIDFVKEKLFIDDTLNYQLNSLPNNFDACQSYTWGEVVIPQQLPFTIDGSADDWADYTPVMTDKTGDSEAGSVMDLEELYMAQDDNYLYLMLKAGDKPGAEWASWGIQLEMDLGVENLCGGTEWVLDNWTERPANNLAFGSLDECEDDPGLQLYHAENIWGDVIEMRILLAYLHNPPEIDIFYVESFLVPSDYNFINPDEMR